MKKGGIALTILGVLTLPFGIVLLISGVALILLSKKRQDNSQNSTESAPPSDGSAHRIGDLRPRIIKNTSVSSSFAYTGGPTFGSWDTSIHLTDGQLVRFGRAAYGVFPIQPFSKGIVKITGSRGNTYYTSLDSCDCKDFERRHLPCKHIYALALSMGYTADSFYSNYLDTICSDGIIPRPAIGYSNGLRKYQVHGVNPETKRRNKRYVYALDETDASSAARSSGLADPIEVSGLADDDDFSPINSYQQEYAKECSIAIPPSADSFDIHSLIYRYERSDTATVPIGLLKFATKRHIPCSLLSGFQELSDKLLSKLPRRDQIALYAAAVRCSLDGTSIVDSYDDPVSDICYSFADLAFLDEQLYRTLLNNLSPDKLQRPDKRSVSYRSVVKFFNKAPA